MTSDETKIRRCLVANAEKIAPVADNGLAVFSILGDPHFVSIFSRLCAVIAETQPDIEFRIEPGISTITAFASAAGILVNSSFSGSDGSVDKAGIYLKVQKPNKKADELRSEGFSEFVLVERMFFSRYESVPERRSSCRKRLHKRDVCPEIILK